MSDSTLLVKLEQATHEIERLEKHVTWQAQQLKDVFGALPAEFAVAFTGDYAIYTRAIVERLRAASLVFMPADYGLVTDGETKHGDLCWNIIERAWHHVRREGESVRLYHVVIRKKKV